MAPAAKSRWPVDRGSIPDRSVVRSLSPLCRAKRLRALISQLDFLLFRATSSYSTKIKVNSRTYAPSRAFLASFWPAVRSAEGDAAYELLAGHPYNLLGTWGARRRPLSHVSIGSRVIADESRLCDGAVSSWLTSSCVVTVRCRCRLCIALCACGPV